MHSYVDGSVSRNDINVMNAIVVDGFSRTDLIFAVRGVIDGIRHSITTNNDVILRRHDVINLATPVVIISRNSGDDRR